MLDILQEKENVWDHLAKTNTPIAIYGMGNAAERIISEISSRGKNIDAVFASDEFVRGQSFLGHRVLKYSDVKKMYGSFTVVLAFATHIDSVIENIKNISLEQKVYAPDIPVAGGGLFGTEYVKENEKKFDFVYDHLADDESRRVFRSIIDFKISGKIKYLLNTFCSKNEIYGDILKLSGEETIADLGAYDGDTIKEFTSFTNGAYRHIYALEPDEKNYKKLVKNTESMKDITLYNLGAWDKKDTLFFDKKAGRNSKLSSSGTPVQVSDIDSLISAPVSLIKMDIEGSEAHAIDGARNIIKKYAPKLYICAYHRNEDMFALPLKILDIRDDYKIFFRHSKYIPAWECNFYCVKEQ